MDGKYGSILGKFPQQLSRQSLIKERTQKLTDVATNFFFFQIEPILLLIRDNNINSSFSLKYFVQLMMTRFFSKESLYVLNISLSAINEGKSQLF